MGDAAKISNQGMITMAEGYALSDSVDAGVDIKKQKSIADPLYVTQPFLPPLEEFLSYLRNIWESKQLTNGGRFHEELEQALADYLEVPYCSLFCNGTMALLVGLKALGVTGSIVTTPFSFPATVNAISWNGNEPVFCDIDFANGNLDPEKVEKVLGRTISAILPVHIYGIPCDVERFDFLSHKHSIPVVYDAAHAFGVKIRGRSLLSWGEFSILSFHATKIFQTFEGGLLVTSRKELKEKVDLLRNFGIADEVTLSDIGVNAKMNELQAACGLLQLRYIEDNIEKNQRLEGIYRDYLKSLPGISFPAWPLECNRNYSYVPILIDEEKLGQSRDGLCERLRLENIFCRKYFYPLISESAPYSSLSSASCDNLPLAWDFSRRALCLPIYPAMQECDVLRVCSAITEIVS